MVLSPIDIEQKTFRVALRGYAEEEVDQFLDEIVIAIREYERQLRDANERVAVLEAQLEANRETEDRIKKTLIIAQRTADQVVQEARTEAQQLLTEARTHASEIEIERMQERDSLVGDLDRMRSAVAALKERIVGMADSTRGNLEAIQADIVAVQPHGDGVDSWDDFPVDLDEDDDHDSSEDASAGDWDDDDDESPEGAEEDIDQMEESSGQVILGSGPRPWERNQSDD